MNKDIKTVVKIGMVQMSMLDYADLNMKKAESAIRDLAERGAQIVCVPELFLSRYFCQTRDDRFFDLAQSVHGGYTDILSALSKELEIVIIASLFEKSDEHYFNTAIVMDADGAYLGKYRKMHIPDDPEHGFDEAYYFEKGDLGFKVFETKFGSVAPMVCWDQWFPEAARMASMQGAQILLYPTAIGWNTKVDSLPIQKAEHEAWQIIQRSHAIANGVFVVAVNRVGTEQDLQFWGSSFVCDPYGRVVAQASSGKEENIIAECDLSVINEMRSSWPFIENRRINFQL